MVLNVRQFNSGASHICWEAANQPRKSAWAASEDTNTSLTAEPHHHPFTTLHRSANLGQHSAKFLVEREGV